MAPLNTDASRKANLAVSSAITERMRGLVQPVGIDARLSPDSGPRAMQIAALPEAGLVLEHDGASAASSLPADRRQALGAPEFLRLLVGACRLPARPLHREPELMQPPRDGSAQPQRRLDRHRPPVRHDRLAPVGTIAYEMQRRKYRYGVVTMCVGGGHGGRGAVRAGVAAERASLADPADFCPFVRTVAFAETTATRPIQDRTLGFQAATPGTDPGEEPAIDQGLQLMIVGGNVSEQPTPRYGDSQ